MSDQEKNRKLFDSFHQILFLALTKKSLKTILYKNCLAGETVPWYNKAWSGEERWRNGVRQGNFSSFPSCCFVCHTFFSRFRLVFFWLFFQLSYTNFFLSFPLLTTFLPIPSPEQFNGIWNSHGRTGDFDRSHKVVLIWWNIVLIDMN